MRQRAEDFCNLEHVAASRNLEQRSGLRFEQARADRRRRPGRSAISAVKERRLVQAFVGGFVVVGHRRGQRPHAISSARHHCRITIPGDSAIIARADRGRAGVGIIECEIKPIAGIDRDRAVGIEINAGRVNRSQ